MWANRAQQKHNFLDPGDVDQALQTASAIGDDRLQKETQGYVVPDAFTHGTSEQRKRWFMNGFNTARSGSAIRFRRPLCSILINIHSRGSGNPERTRRCSAFGGGRTRDQVVKV